MVIGEQCQGGLKGWGVDFLLRNDPRPFRVEIAFRTHEACRPANIGSGLRRFALTFLSPSSSGGAVRSSLSGTKIMSFRVTVCLPSCSTPLNSNKMKKRNNHSSATGTLRITLALALISIAMILLASSFKAAPGFVSVPTTGATIHVTTLQQKIGGQGTGGCSLQEAIYSSVLHNTADGVHGLAIDATDPDHVVTTDCEVGTGNGDTIVLPTGGVFNLNYSLDGDGDAHNPFGPTVTPIIFSTMTIEGHGA